MTIECGSVIFKASSQLLRDAHKVACGKKFQSIYQQLMALKNIFYCQSGFSIDYCCISAKE